MIIKLAPAVDFAKVLRYVRRSQKPKGSVKFLFALMRSFHIKAASEHVGKINHNIIKSILVKE